MDSEPRSGSNTVLYAVIGVVLFGVLGGCCVVAGAVGVLVSARTRAAEEVSRVRERNRAERDRDLFAPEPEVRGALGPTLDVSSTPPVSLGLVLTPSTDRRWRHVEATVTRSRGSIGVSEGDTCSFDVQVLDRAVEPGHYCRTFAQCNDVRLFGEEVPRRTGFFPCQLYDQPFGVAGEDLEPTQDAATGDPLFQIDTRAMTFTVADDVHGRLGAAYHVVARIDSVTPR